MDISKYKRSKRPLKKQFLKFKAYNGTVYLGCVDASEKKDIKKKYPAAIFYEVYQEEQHKEACAEYDRTMNKLEENFWQDLAEELNFEVDSLAWKSFRDYLERNFDGYSYQSLLDEAIILLVMSHLLNA